ncbi:MAG: helix-turn-helix domain-containing protein [Polyangiales bacterium]
MKKEQLTIGELARRTGLPVKTLRFWSDEGLLPPASRSSSGYRMYGEDALIQLDLVRTLRDADVGLDTIRKVLRHDLSLADALRLQLAAVEAHVASLQGVAAALRAALRGECTESDLRRLYAVTRLTNEDRKAVIEQFHARIAEGLTVDDAWRKKMMAEGTPKLPDNPTAAQLDAWVELAELVSDPSFVEGLRASAKQIQDKNIDMNRLRIANEEVGATAGRLRASGAAPSSTEARAMVRAYVEAVARASGKTADETFYRMFRERFAAHDPRNARYRELLSIMNGQPSPTGTADDWRFIAEAVKHHT